MPRASRNLRRRSCTVVPASRRRYAQPRAAAGKPGRLLSSLRPRPGRRRWEVQPPPPPSRATVAPRASARSRTARCVRVRSRGPAAQASGVRRVIHGRKSSAVTVTVGPYRLQRPSVGPLKAPRMAPIVRRHGMIRAPLSVPSAPPPRPAPSPPRPSSRPPPPQAPAALCSPTVAPQVSLPSVRSPPPPPRRTRTQPPLLPPPPPLGGPTRRCRDKKRRRRLRRGPRSLRRQLPLPGRRQPPCHGRRPLPCRSRRLLPSHARRRLRYGGAGPSRWAGPGPGPGRAALLCAYCGPLGGGGGGGAAGRGW